MKYYFLRAGAGLMIVCSLAAISMMGFSAKRVKDAAAHSGKGFAVIELFTSEGCSSCPAADAEVEKLAVMYPADVYVLGFHVDYWNRLGWKDSYSNAAYSERQWNYADHFKLDGVYTPQVVVNGKVQLVGSDDAGLNKSIAEEFKHTPNQSVQ